MARTPNGTTEGLGSKPARNKSLNREPAHTQGTRDKEHGKDERWKGNGPPSLQFFMKILKTSRNFEYYSRSNTLVFI